MDARVPERQQYARQLSYPEQTDCELWLQEICRRFLTYFPNVVEPRAYIAPDEKFEPGIDAYYWQDANRIDFRESYFNRSEIWAIEMLMRHELIHAWTWFNALEDDDWHGTAFQSMEQTSKAEFSTPACSVMVTPKFNHSGQRAPQTSALFIS